MTSVIGKIYWAIATLHFIGDLFVVVKTCVGLIPYFGRNFNIRIVQECANDQHS